MCLLTLEQPLFFGLKPVNYLSVACPHMGARLLGDKSVAVRVFRALARFAGGRHDDAPLQTSCKACFCVLCRYLVT